MKVLVDFISNFHNLVQLYIAIYHLFYKNEEVPWRSCFLEVYEHKVDLLVNSDLIKQL